MKCHESWTSCRSIFQVVSYVWSINTLGVVVFIWVEWCFFWFGIAILATIKSKRWFYQIKISQSRFNKKLAGHLGIGGLQMFAERRSSTEMWEGRCDITSPRKDRNHRFYSCSKSRYLRADQSNPQQRNGHISPAKSCSDGRFHRQKNIIFWDVSVWQAKLWEYFCENDGWLSELHQRNMGIQVWYGFHNGF